MKPENPRARLLEAAGEIFIGRIAVLPQNPLDHHSQFRLDCLLERLIDTRILAKGIHEVTSPAVERQSMAQVVEICPYDPAWPSLFAALGVRLRDALASVALRIDHIGSTAVPGLAAKPIVDVQVSIAAFDPVDTYRVPLEGLGLVFRSENTERTKRYFREAPGTRRAHIHVRRAGSWAEQFALLFRDYLRVHPEDRDRYAELKRRLARELRDDRHAYTEAKAPLIWEVMSRADRWSQNVGWEPGPSDA